MLLFSVVFQYFWALEFITCSENVKTELINTYLERQPNSQVTAFLCWDFESKIYLAKSLFEKNIKVKIQQPNEIFLNSTSNARHIFILDVSCQNSWNLLRIVNDTYYFRSPNHWLILLSKPSTITSESVEEQLNKFQILIDSKVVIAQEIGDTEFVLKYVYKLGVKANLTVEIFASWIYPDKLLIYGNEILSRTRHNLRGYVIRTAMVVQYNDTFSHFDDYRNSELDTLTKINYVLFHILMDYMNATRVVRYVPNWYTLTNNQNNTLLGALLDKEIDIGGTPLFCKSGRTSWYKCLVMTTPARGFFIFRQPPLTYVKNIFAMPFSRNLWLTDMSILLFSSVLLYVIILWEWELLEEENTVPELDLMHPTFSDSVLFTIGAHRTSLRSRTEFGQIGLFFALSGIYCKTPRLLLLPQVCQQGYATEPKGGPGKVLILTMFVTLIFLFTAYTAYVVVLFQSTADDIKDLEDLYNSKIEMGCEDQPYLKSIFASYKDPLRTKIYTERLNANGPKPKFYELKNGIEKVRKEYFAFHTSQLSGYKVIHDTFLQHEKCGLQEIVYLDESDPYMVAPLETAYIEIYKIGFYKIKEAGLNHREIQRRISKKPECTSQGNNYRSAGLLDLYSVYMLLIIGVILSVCLLICEIIVQKFVSFKLDKFVQ